MTASGDPGRSIRVRDWHISCGGGRRHPGGRAPENPPICAVAVQTTGSVLHGPPELRREQLEVAVQYGSRLLRRGLVEQDPDRQAEQE